MRITAPILAVSLIVASTGLASAQGLPRAGSGGAQAAPADDTGTGGRRGNPAGVIDGTNPNPDADRAGGIRSPGRDGVGGGADTGAAVGAGAPSGATAR